MRPTGRNRPATAGLFGVELTPHDASGHAISELRREYRSQNPEVRSRNQNTGIAESVAAFCVRHSIFRFRIPTGPLLTLVLW